MNQEYRSLNCKFVFSCLSLIGAFLLASVAHAQQPSDRFSALEDHILGTDTMTIAEFEDWATVFAGEAEALGDRLEDFVAAVEVVELYEDRVGPLFTGQGIVSFNNSWEGEMNLERALGRAMFGVYQAIFDAYDNDLVAQQSNLVQGVMFRSTENFPGTVPNPSDPAVIYSVRIDGTVNEEFGSEGGYHTAAARRMTGAYLAPGTIVDVIVPDELVDAGFQVRVGGHSWDLSNKNTANRLHRVSNVFDIDANLVRVANPVGGNLYIDVPVGADVGIVEVQFRNAIRAPFFSNRSFDKTTRNQWENVERHHPGAFTDIESEQSMWTVPSKWVDDLGYDELMEIVDAHDANMRVASRYVGKNVERHKAILYMIVDTQIRANAFSTGYPQANYGNFAQNSIRAPLTLDHARNTTLWHEHGHAELMTMFSGEPECWIHMLSTVISMENYGMTAQEGFANSLSYGSSNHTTSDALKSWVVMDEFIDGEGMGRLQGSYRPRGHADYVEYIEMFGVEAMQNFNRRINIEMNGLQWDNDWPVGRISHNANDRILRLSREACVNVAPLFHLWGHNPSDVDALLAAMEEEGHGESVQIYDRLIQARDSVPMSQAQWNAVDGVMEDFLNEARGPWEELRTNYDLDRAQAAVDRIQTLIDLYFPNGRPDEVVAPEKNLVIAFSQPNFEGESWILTPGLYLVEQLDATTIGNDNISSIQIPAGFEVRVAQEEDNSGTTAAYTSSVADLGLLDDEVSRIEVLASAIRFVPDANNNLDVNANWISDDGDVGFPGVGDRVVVDVDSFINTSGANTLSAGGNIVFGGGATLTAGVDFIAAVPNSVTFNDHTVNATDDIFAGGSDLIFNTGSVAMAGDDFEANSQGTITVNGGFHTVGDQFGAQRGSVLYFFGGTVTSGGFRTTAGNNSIPVGGTINIGGDANLTTSSVSLDASGAINFDSSWIGALTNTNFSGSDWQELLANSSNGSRTLGSNEITSATAFDGSVVGEFEITNGGQTLGIVPELLVLLGDVNRDGFVDFLDISPFISQLSSGNYQVEADMNQDSVVNFLDISFFIAALAS